MRYLGYVMLQSCTVCMSEDGIPSMTETSETVAFNFGTRPMAIFTSLCVPQCGRIPTKPGQFTNSQRALAFPASTPLASQIGAVLQDTGSNDSDAECTKLTWPNT